MKKVRMVFLVLGLAGVVFMGGFSFKEILRGEKLSATPLGQLYSDGLFGREAIASENCSLGLYSAYDACIARCSSLYLRDSKEWSACYMGCYYFARDYRLACEGKIVVY
jgi:hypothetical protein